MQSLSRYNKGFNYLLCVIDLFSKYAWVIPIEHNKGTSIVNAIKEIISKRQRNQIKYGLIKAVNFTISVLKTF